MERTLRKTMRGSPVSFGRVVEIRTRAVSIKGL